MRAQLKPGGDMPSIDARESEDRWQWDIVSWLAIALLGVFVLLLVMLLSPHGNERQLKEHMRQHANIVGGAR